MADPGSAYYDVIVVGAGMIGSAAAKHLTDPCSGLTDRRVLLIGPGEPQDRSSRDIFGSWYDEGRITRRLDNDYVWSHLAEKSINRYRQLEDESGIRFYHETGYLIAGQRSCSYNKDVIKIAAMMNYPVARMDREHLREAYPYFELPGGYEGILSRSDSGHISPRRMVKAQQIIASKNGCHIKDGVVAEVRHHGDKIEVVTDSGDVYACARVLLATGAFTTSRSLLPRGVIPDLDYMPSTVILVRIDTHDADRLKSMPSMFVIKDENERTDTDFDVYILPPIKYPDGHYYIKIGHSRTKKLCDLTSADEMKSWFQGDGNVHMASKLLAILRTHFPDIKPTFIKTDRCVMSKTATWRPMIDMVRPQIGVALGGNGTSAKCSDELGYIAARMITRGKWDYSDLPDSLFRFKTKLPQSML